MHLGGSMFSRRDFCAGTLALTAPRWALAQSNGSFLGDVVAQWQEDGRYMTLLKPFEYRDAAGVRWIVPRGAIIDGASIPQLFWSVIGGPFEGKYRKASVVHDFYCQVRTRPYRDVHQVFYEGMRTAGVSDEKSWLMFEAVNRFGPRWNKPSANPKCEEYEAETYDFALCTRVTSMRAVSSPRLDKNTMEAFLKDAEGHATEADLELLRAKTAELP